MTRNEKYESMEAKILSFQAANYDSEVRIREQIFFCQN